MFRIPLDVSERSGDIWTDAVAAGTWRHFSCLNRVLMSTYTYEEVCVLFRYATLLGSVDDCISDTLAEYGIRYDDAYARLCGGLSLEDLFCTDSVLVAAKRAGTGFSGKADTQRFMSSSWLNSYVLCQKVLDGRFKPRYYRSRVIVERGKERTIVPPTFECKVVQKVLCELLLRPLLTHRMISTSYASISGRGTDMMYEDVLRALNHVVRTSGSLSDFRVVTCDYRHFFDSIDTRILRESVLERYINDDDVVRLIMSFFPSACGLPIGSEVSQMPATFFPSPVDHAMKDGRGLPYFRYMDDTLAIVPACDVASYVEEYRDRSSRIGLCVPDEKVHVIQLGSCLSFCKERFRFVRGGGDGRYVREVNPRRVSTERRKLRRFCELVASGDMDADVAMAQWRSVRGSLTSHPRTRADVVELDALAEAIAS